MSKLTRSAKGQQCLVRLPGVCNYNPDTTVLAHLNGGGMGTKSSDLHASFSCSSCHAWLDGGWVKDSSRQERDLAHLQAVIRTQEHWLKQGLIRIIE